MSFPLKFMYYDQDNPSVDFLRMLRGRCKDKCDCPSYFWDGKSPTCLCCSHPPALHENLGSAPAKSIYAVKDMGVTPSFPQDNVQLPSWDITSGSKVQDSALENDLLALLNEGSTMISGIDNGAASSSAHSGQIKRKPAKKVTRERVVFDPKKLEAFSEEYETEEETASPTVSPEKSSTPIEPRSSPRIAAAPALFTRAPTPKRKGPEDMSATPGSSRQSPKRRSQPSNSIVVSLAGISSEVVDKLNAIFPKKWPADLADAFEANSWTRAQKCEAIRILVYRMDEEGLTLDRHFQYMAAVAREKITLFRNVLVTKKTDVLVTQMKECLKNKRSSARRKLKGAKSAGTPAQTGEEAKKMMQECSPASTSLDRYKILLKACHKLRMSETRLLTASEMITQYPAFKRTELIFWEFEQMVKLRLKDLEDAWVTALPELREYFALNDSGDQGNSVSIDAGTVEVLFALQENLGPKRKSKTETRQLIYVFEERTTVRASIPSAKDPPCMIAVGSRQKENLSFTVYADSQALFVGGAVKSLLALLASYWVFNIEFETSVRLPLTCVSAIMMPSLMTEKAAKYVTVNNVLEALKRH